MLPIRSFRPARLGRAAFVMLLLALTAAAVAQASPSGLRVQGSGTVYGEPDVALLTLGVDITAPKVKTALADADQAMRAVRQVFVQGGVEPKDVRTVTFNVWREDIRNQSGTVTGQRYHVVHSYQVTLRDTSRLGELLGAAVDAGANNVQGIRFTLSDPSALQAEARAAAMRDARSRAQQLARLAGVTLGKPISIEESTSSLASPAPTMAAARVGGGGAPVESGQLAVHAQVTVVYAIQ